MKNISKCNTRFIISDNYSYIQSAVISKTVNWNRLYNLVTKGKSTYVTHGDSRCKCETFFVITREWYQSQLTIYPGPWAYNQTTPLLASHVDDNHGVSDVFMIGLGGEVAATNSFNMGNHDGRPGSDVTNVYESIDAPHEQPGSLDVPQRTWHLSQVMKRNMSKANNTSASSGLYDHIQSPDESTVATPTPKTPDGTFIATETPSTVVYSQVNKPQKRALPHSALSTWY